MSLFTQDAPQTLVSSYLEAFYHEFSLSYLSNYIDFSSLGWVLFFLAMLIYLVSKEQWMHLRNELQRLVMIDPLTLLPNRRLLEDRANQILKSCQRDGKGFAVILGDLDYFKVVNDTLGHQAGDLLLQEIASRFSTVIRGEDTVARLGGDEFVFLVQGATQQKDISVVLQRIYASLEQPIAIQDCTFNIGISLGVAFFPEHGLTFEGLLRRADMSLYRAKALKNTYQVYNEEDEAELDLGKITKHHDLRKAG